MGDVGLYAKYIITKADGTPVNDRCFILKPDKDPAAAKALQAYAAETDDEQLRDDLYAWVGKPMLKPMTLKEAVEKAFVYREWKDCGADREPILLTYIYDEYDETEMLALQEFSDDAYDIVNEEDYGKTWRCWERRPTDEERGAAEWET